MSLGAAPAAGGTRTGVAVPMSLRYTGTAMIPGRDRAAKEGPKGKRPLRTSDESRLGSGDKGNFQTLAEYQADLALEIQRSRGTETELGITQGREVKAGPFTTVDTGCFLGSVPEREQESLRSTLRGFGLSSTSTASTMTGVSTEQLRQESKQAADDFEQSFRTGLSFREVRAASLMRETSTTGQASNTREDEPPPVALPVAEHVQSTEEVATYAPSLTPSRSSRKKWYAVFRGHVPGAYREWETAQLQLARFSNNSYLGFNTLGEAVDALRRYGLHVDASGHLIDQPKDCSGGGSRRNSK